MGHIVTLGITHIWGNWKDQEEEEFLILNPMNRSTTGFKIIIRPRYPYFQAGSTVPDPIGL